MTTPALDVRDYDGLALPVPGTFAIDPAHTEVSAVVRHLVVSKVRGAFTGVTGMITIGADPLASTVTAQIPAGTINTGVAERDAHLRSADFLDAATYPTLDFRSTGLRRRGGDRFVLAGDLTIRGVTRPVELDLVFDGVARSPWGQEVVAFSASTEFDREDFGITWNKALETGGVLVGPKVRVEISAEAVREA
jgi:polyisoprenoid-binding protein YceI